MFLRSSAIALLAVASCGRLGFEASSEAVDAAPVPDAPGADAGLGLGDACGDTDDLCNPGLICVLSTCSCLAQVKSDERQTCTLTPGGEVVCSGDNASGELGNGTVGGFETEPAPVAGLPELSSLDLGAFHACGLDGDGALWCWGQIDAEEATGTPYRVGLGEGATEVASGGFHTCVRAGETVRCLGRNVDGQLGRGAISNTETSLGLVPGLTDVVSVASGGFHTCALLDLGNVMCWGRNSDGQIGDGTTSENRASPTPVLGITDAVQLTAGDFHSCARHRDGTVSCWGRNARGQLGRGLSTPQEPTPAPVFGLTGAVDLFSGDDTVCAIDTAGLLSCWGNNSDGQLGFASTAGFEVQPSAFPALPVIDVAIGRVHTCALERGGAVLCSGQNTAGELGTGDAISTSEPVRSLLSCGP